MLNILSNNTKNISNLVKAEFSKVQKQPKRIAITGAAGQIGYSLLFRIASGQMLGADQPVILHLIDLPQAQNALKGVQMELNDCAFPLLSGVVTTDNFSTGFKDVDYALLVGAKPRGPGMERADLLKDNGKIFIDTGKAISDNAPKTIKCLVVGNPANTNCLILQHYAKNIPKENFTAMTKLDHNRGLYQLSEKLNVHINDIEKFGIWGNHSPTMVPMLSETTVKGKKIYDSLDHKWIDTYFHPKVGKRGGEIIEARKSSSAASAGNAAIDHFRDWVHGSRSWTSFGVLSDGKQYGVPKDIIFSFPVITKDGKWDIVKDIKISEYYQSKIDITTKELLEERKAIEDLLK